MKIVNQTEFDELIKSGITLVDFYADWCGPCKMLGPILESLDEEYPDINFVKINCDNDIAVADRYGILSIPAVFIIKDGKVIANTLGYHAKEDMKKFIDNAIK